MDTDPDDTDEGDNGNPGNEAAKYRRRLRAAEAERDALAHTLAKTRQAIVDNAVQAAGVDPRLMVAAGHTLDALLDDDGLIDATKLSEAITHTSREFRIAPRGRPPQPSQQQGHRSGQPSGKPSWSSAVKGSSD